MLPLETEKYHLAHACQAQFDPIWVPSDTDWSSICSNVGDKVAGCLKGIGVEVHPSPEQFDRPASMSAGTGRKISRKLSANSKYELPPGVPISAYTEEQVILFLINLRFKDDVIDRFKENAIDGEMFWDIEMRARAGDMSDYEEKDHLALKPLQIVSLLLRAACVVRCAYIFIRCLTEPDEDGMLIEYENRMCVPVWFALSERFGSTLTASPQPTPTSPRRESHATLYNARCPK